VFESEASNQVCASATKIAVFAAQSQLSFKDLLCPPVLRPMVWSRHVTEMDQIHHGWDPLFHGREEEALLERETGNTPSWSRAHCSTGFSCEHLPALGQRQAARGSMAKCDSFQDGLFTAGGRGPPLRHVPTGMAKELAPDGLS